MSEIKSTIKNSRVYPLIFVETFLSSRLRRWLYGFCWFLFAVSGVSLELQYFSRLSLPINIDLVSSIFLLSFASIAVVFSLKAFFSANYLGPADETVGDLQFTLMAAKLIEKSRQGGLMTGLLETDFGREWLIRLEIKPSEFKQFLTGQTLALPDNDSFITFTDLIGVLLDKNNRLKEYLAGRGITKDDAKRAADFISRREDFLNHHRFWWRPENLEKISGLAKDWAYGQTFTLNRYSHDLPAHLRPISSRQKEIDQMINVLSRQRETNVVLVSDTAEARLEAVCGLAGRIKTGRVPADLEWRRPVLFSTTSFFSAQKTKAEAEAELIKILSEAVKAGNIILIIDDFGALFRGLASLDSNFGSIADPFLSSSRLPIVALANLDSFHRLIARDSSLTGRFDKIEVVSLAYDEVLAVVENLASWQEAKRRIIFSYLAIKEIVKSADRYFTEGDLADKALDLLTELASTDGGSDRFVSRAEVVNYIADKTKIPIGDIKPAEKDKLERLESVLAKRVIGQSEALALISGAMRRARTAVSNPNRPIGSFLFLGPTGVGKTETAKALAETFFESEKNLLRLDMSEYQTTDSLNRLIGSFALGQPGTLSTMIRENPYAVILLDEFEKADPNVLNLFLQILDEGIFADMDGRKVNARNIIFIATSNAGADMIWQIAKTADDLNDHKSELIDNIVKQGIYKPELLNRFDAVVVFQPLQGENLIAVAKLMLQRLSTRLKNQGINLVIDNDLAVYVARHGSDPTFGARPMNRFIQDNIEQLIADKLIAGEIISGQQVYLVPDGVGRKLFLRVE